MKHIQLSIFVLLISAFQMFAQSDPVLFTVENTPVHLSEFEYIYSKNNSNDLDYSKESLEEYLDLYVKFKLKVQKAKDLKMDTIPALQKELEGYRRQLAKSYLTDKEVTERLMKEAYERQATDVSIQHILFKLDEKSTEKDRQMAEKQANDVYQMLMDGMDFDGAIKKYSEDRFSNRQNGSLGYMTAMFPSGFYELETAAYKLNPGEISKPVRTKLGYHVIKVLDKRPARGEMEVAHILIRKKSQRKMASDPKATIDSIYTALQGGAEFAELARKFSEDLSSAKEGGYIGFFGINRFEKSFEDAAFSLPENGGYTEPIESSVGWHIIKRISTRVRPDFAEAKKILKSQVLKDSRYKIATESLVDRIKKEASFKENLNVLELFTKELDESFFSYKWEIPSIAAYELFSFGDEKYTIQDFGNYAKNNARDRLRMDEMPIAEAVMKLYHTYVDDSAIKYEETQLENKYPDFKSLMREYEEGILLFEVTKDNVWDVASTDSVGLTKFYENHRDNYMWKERANVIEYKVQTTDEKLIKKIAKKAKRKSPEYLKEKFGDIFEVTENTYERGSKELSGFKFAKNSVSTPRVDEKKGVTNFKKITSIIPVTYKTMGEARGYIEADYQDKLERQWVSNLRQQYQVDINQDVLNSLIK